MAEGRSRGRDLRAGGEAEGPVLALLAVDHEPPREAGAGVERDGAHVDGEGDVDRAPFGHAGRLAGLEVAPDLDRLRAVRGVDGDLAPVGVDQEQLPVVRLVRLVPTDL